MYVKYSEVSKNNMNYVQYPKVLLNILKHLETS